MHPDAMAPSPSYRDAAAATSRRRRLATSGRRTTASVRAVRPTGELVGISPAVEMVLEIDAGARGARVVTVVEPVPLALSTRVVPGAELTVLVADDSGELAIEWSA
jgi:hypothetical protein